MIHCVYLIAFAVLAGLAFGVFAAGNVREKVLAGLKAFAQFVVISLILAWIFYFIPW